MALRNLTKSINSSSTCRADSPTSAFHVSDVPMDDATERDNDSIPASTAYANASTSAFQELGTSGIAMENAPDRDNNGSSADAGRYPSQRMSRLVPRHYDDLLPADEDTNPSDSSANHPPSQASQNPPQRKIQRVLLTLRDSLQTVFNAVGLCRQYPRRPSFEPDKFIQSSLLARSCPVAADAHTRGSDSSPELSEPPYPFLNMTIYRLMTWMNSGSHQKSEKEVTRLVREVIQAEDFNPSDLDGFSVRRSLRTLDNTGGKGTVTFPDDWLETDIVLDIPTKSKDDESRSFTIPGLHYRPLTAVIRSAFADIQANAFHLFPFKRLWKDPLDNHQERVFDELYTSDSWLEAHDHLQRQPREPNCSLERVIAGLMFFSDATHLANFGTAKAWPLYLYFGNLTKYARSAPTSGACHLVGFFPSLPDNVKDVLNNLPRISKSGMAALHAHCRRDLFQSCWKHLLDADFIQAYRHGMVLRCPDGILRRVFPRIFTYSADYPEKVLLATIKDMGSCPCPRCFTPKASFDLLGLFRDMQDRVNDIRTYCLASVSKAREFIYREGNTVDGSKVQAALGEGSWVPTVNTFAQRLGPLGFDVFRMLVVDFMHECELGTWKALFTHLIRLLYALPGGDSLVAMLNGRFRQVPSYGNGVIRKFANNTSEMKRLAARDFEDILQCAIPVFEGLFPGDHDATIQSLLYRFAQWHALAKLRMHSDSTLAALDGTFKILSRQLRKFRDFTCAAFATVELLKERAARERKATRERLDTNNADAGSGGRKAKKFNLNTYKFHAMGDYFQSIRLFGTVDSFTTQIGELAHRALKVFYPLTSKINTPAQLAKHERRRRVLRRVAETGHSSQTGEQQPVDSARSKDHHYISKLDYNNPLQIFRFLRDHGDDPAVSAFIPKLKDHILYRLRNLDVSYCDHVFTEDERNSIIIPDNRLYSVQIMQVYYTTYDLRREHDTINPRTHPDIMVLSGETRPQHPYWYARVLGIYHVEVWLNTDGPAKKHRVEVLYVRWLAPLIDHQSGMSYARLPKVAFVEDSDRDAFGTHLIPAFASGRGSSSLRYGRSFTRQSGELDDWEAYYIGIFVDRDMFMRYTHHGIGHPAVLREITRDCANTGFADGGPEAEENENDQDFNLRPYGDDLENDSDNCDCKQESDDDVDDEDDGEDESSVDGLDDQAEYDENEEDDYIYF
ncbi:hypothetical protein CY34DRAFT_16981 [Suillus luteus UH-Slu-Lm8-n1]|uniref:Unplaced genomic scaffold CY34scaffold_487, whole genome shotgun sequence n=1 Tax=Suillus luteus UH-Slu-Lm8-n1 TaxID=930992 RepID=A0A0D0AMT7_9AGAM|nr:hypothetical protein CY34DRAFT_16981 [Suillus luteus UH-Slu-Lm8-n1]